MGVFLRSSLMKILLLLTFLFLLCGGATAAVPEVANTMVTDVTTVSFSVIWSASEPSTAGIEVFEDSEGLVPVDTVAITPHPVESGDSSIQTAAEDNGVMKVRVTGLEAGNTYYFRTITTSKSTSDEAVYPAAAPYNDVTTEVATVRDTDGVPFSNDIIIEPCYLEDGVTPAEGTLLLATMEGADYPLTSFVGDGVEAPYALIDLNNAFGRDSKENLDLEQGKNLTLLNFRGIQGNSIVTHNVPEDESLSEVKEGEVFLKPGWNFISIQLNPENNEIETALSSFWESIVSVWAYDTLSDTWSRYDKNNPFPWLNDLNEISHANGYWIFTENEGSLKIDGQLVVGESISLNQGWNLVGFTEISTIDLSEAIMSIDDSINSIWTYNTESDSWQRYDKYNPFPWLNDLEVIEPGKAYWIDANSETVWTLH